MTSFDMTTAMIGLVKEARKDDLAVDIVFMAMHILTPSENITEDTREAIEDATALMLIKALRLIREDSRNTVRQRTIAATLYAMLDGDHSLTNAMIQQAMRTEEN